MAVYKKLPRSRMEVNADGMPSVMSYTGLKQALGPKITTDRIAKAPNVAPYEAPPSARKSDRADVKPRGMAPQQKAAEARDARQVTKAPALSKGSTQPQAYTGVKGDTATKRGAVTSYQANGYTYNKNSQGNYQNFKAGSQPTKRKGSDR